MSTTTVIPFVRRSDPRGAACRTRSPPRVPDVLRMVVRWIERRRQRDALADLAEDPHLLRDIGLTREQALREAGKDFWR